MVRFFKSPDGLSLQNRLDMASLIHEGFRDMFAPVFKFVREEDRVPLLSSILTWNLGFYCEEDDRIKGVGLLISSDREYCSVPRDAVGKLGLLRYLVLRWVFRHQGRRGILRLEMFTVDEACRGQGIGTGMMKALIRFYRDEGYRTLSLGVVDTNPRARRLYESLDFRVVKTGKASWIGRRAGFNGYVVMEHHPD